MKPVSACVAGMLWLAVLVGASGDERPSSSKDKARGGGASLKRGIGLPERHGFGEKHLEELHVAWYYNWGPATKLKTKALFVPMVFSMKSLDADISGDFVLGFNEPDHIKQSNISVEEAFKHWPKVARQVKHVGSPAVAGNPVTGDWLPAFMKGNPKVDFITVHWYKGVDSKHFIKDMQAVHDKYKKPIWVTEFAPQTAANSKENPTKFTQEQVNQFIADTTHWMETSPVVERYAWHDSGVGTSALFDEKGRLTDSGKAYASVHGQK